MNCEETRPRDINKEVIWQCWNLLLPH